MRNALKLITTGQLGHAFTFEGVYVTTILLIGKDGGCGPRTYDAVAQNAKRLNAKRCKKSSTPSPTRRPTPTSCQAPRRAS